MALPLGSTASRTGYIMNFSSIKNVATNAANPRYLSEMLRKLSARLKGGTDATELEAYCEHCSKHVTDADQWARKIDPVLWEEAIGFGKYGGAIIPKNKTDWT